MTLFANLTAIPEIFSPFFLPSKFVAKFLLMPSENLFLKVNSSLNFDLNSNLASDMGLKPPASIGFFFKSVDLYCERTDFSFWSEPLNAWSNLGFLMAAAFLFFQFKQHQPIIKKNKLEFFELAMPFFLGLVGIFSFLFHTFATQGTGFLDSVFILIFGCLFLFFFTKDLLFWSVLKSLFASVAFAVISFYFSLFLFRGILNGSVGYFPYLVVMGSMTFVTFGKNRPGRKYFHRAFFLFCASLIFRTVDDWICPQFPLGTHFLWHTLNSLTLFFLSWGLFIARKNSMDQV